MIRTIQDFLDRWQYESEATLKVFHNLTDESLQTRVYEGGRTIARLANHIIETLSEMPHVMGLPIQEEHPNCGSVLEIVHAYHEASDRLVENITSFYTDGSLLEETPMYGESWKKGFCLWTLIVHQTHHRAQITVLMRQAGLKVPGVYGPSKEEWQQMGMQAMI